MSDENQEIKIIGVNKEEIEILSNKDGQWVVPFKLSANPDDGWQKRFYDVQQKDDHAMKRKARISEYCMRVEVLSTDDLQQVLDALKAEVAETNVLSEEEYQKKLKIRQELEALQKKQKDATSKFKEESDGLIF